MLSDALTIVFTHGNYLGPLPNVVLRDTRVKKRCECEAGSKGRDPGLQRTRSKGIWYTKKKQVGKKRVHVDEK